MHKILFWWIFLFYESESFEFIVEFYCSLLIIW